MAKDGSLLMADDANGLIYRVAYTGSQSGPSSAPAKVPAAAMQFQTSKGQGVPLANTRPETRPSGPQSVAIDAKSDDFASGAPMPLSLSDYAEGASPQLSWNPVSGARSYAIIMEDPDAKPAMPFVHWIIWNIPGSLSGLPGGLQKQARMTDPEGVLQGRTTRGSIGYYGPKPPIGDPPHHYHIQVLALNFNVDIAGGSDRDTVLKALEGHVIAKGEIVGLFQQRGNPP